MCYGYSVQRRYFTREERAQWLQEYADELAAELKAVNERIQELKSA